MENIETNEDNIPKQKDTSDTTTDELDFLNDEKFKDIKEPLTKTITDLANEDIIPKEDFWKNIEQVTKNIFSDPLFEFDAIAKENQANNIFLFRTKFEKIKKEANKNIKEKTTSKKQEVQNQLLTKKETLYTQLMTTYETIEDVYKPTGTENLSTKYSEITQKTEFQTLLPDEQKNYLKARYSAEKIAEEAKKNNTISEKHVAFIEQFNKLDQELNFNSQIDISSIPREKIKPKDSLNTINDIITNDKIGEDLVANNKSMQNFVTGETNNIKTEEKETMFPLKTIKTKITERYPDKIENIQNDLLQKNNLSKYKDEFKPDGSIKNINKIAEADKKNIQQISETIDKTIITIAEQEQEKLFQEANKVMKTKAVEALVKNIGQYFQVTSFQRGNLAEKCNIDTKNGIEFDQNMLKVSADMDGKNIGFYCDLKNGKVRADDFIAFEGIEGAQEDGVYHINRDKDKIGREQLPYIKMQTLDQIMTDSKSNIINNSEKSIQESKQPEAYSNILSDNTNVFSPKESELGKDIIEHTMEKNTAVQNAHEFVTKYIPTRNTYNQQTEKYEYNVYKIINATFDRYTAEEIKTRNNLFQRFQNKINEKTPNFEDKMISNLFDKTTARTQQRGEYDKDKGPNIYQFMQGLTYESGSTIKQNVIDLTLFDQVVNQLEKESGTTKNIKESKKYQKLWNNFEEQKSQENLDNELDQQLATI